MNFLKKNNRTLKADKLIYNIIDNLLIVLRNIYLQGESQFFKV